MGRARDRCLPHLAFTPFDYQLQTVRTVLRRMRGRAILADEVGLGKTIEAGLILFELWLRGLADQDLYEMVSLVAPSQTMLPANQYTSYYLAMSP
jgi:SNF2 family DNA or RNA helicase